MNKKVGIITLWGTPVNYGQILQAFALSKYIQSIGFETFVLRYKDENIKSYDSWYKKFKRIITGEKSIRAIIKRYTCQHEQTANRGFKEFGLKNLNFTEKIYGSLKELQNNYPYADYYVTGSDQVWGAYGTIESKRVYLLDFLPSDIMRISYAASFGRNQLDDDEKNVFQSALNKFKAIRVREESGCEICRDLNINNCEWVSDPTLLLTKKKWFELLKIDSIQTEEKIALFYILTNDENNKKIYQIAKYLKSNGYTIKYVSSSYYLDKKANFNPTIEEWLSTVDSASLVITNSYHGTIFSLICNTPFFFLSKSNTNEGQNSRLYSVLQKSGLTERIINAYNIKDINNRISNKIDWDFVNNHLGEQRNQSVDFLNKALNIQ